MQLQSLLLSLYKINFHFHLHSCPFPSTSNCPHVEFFVFIHLPLGLATGNWHSLSQLSLFFFLMPSCRCCVLLLAGPTCHFGLRLHAPLVWGAGGGEGPKIKKTTMHDVWYMYIFVCNIQTKHACSVIQSRTPASSLFKTPNAQAQVNFATWHVACCFCFEF